MLFVKKIYCNRLMTMLHVLDADNSLVITDHCHKDDDFSAARRRE